MDKRLILAVAGSGKTRYLIESLDLERRFLLITYTTNNYRNVRDRIIKRFGYFPNNIWLFTYFTYLYSFCFMPLLLWKLRARGINFEPCNNRFARDLARYIDSNRRVYSNRLAKLIEVESSISEVTARIEKYFDVVMIDEIQDFAAHDFNFLKAITQANVDCIFIGDFFQHTFDTSRDGATNKTLHVDYDRYVQRAEALGVTVDQDSLDASYRCSPTLCEYITSHLHINITSHREDQTEITFVDELSDIRALYEDSTTAKLFFKDARRYDCYSTNWGASKGEDHYHDVCIALNPTTFKHYKEGRLVSLKAQTRNKLYVALSRASGNVYLIEENVLKKAVA